MLGLASESVVAAVQATKKVRVHHSDRPVTSYDVRQNTGTVCQYATSTRARAHTHTHTHTNTHTQTHTHKHTHTHTGTLLHRRLGREYVITHWQRFSGDRIPVGGEIFRTRPDRPWDPPILLYTMGTRSLSWG